ncbi:MAG TPA: ribonuclease P protein component [Polyangiales bacterium]|nr:ribonuclease P protein component [Polyangiales bacterium]
MPSGAGPAEERPSQRLRPRDRLRKRFEFRRLRDEGRRVHTRSFVLSIARGDQPQARLGITVSRQVGNAVRRNRLKRLLREAFRLERALVPSASDLVVIAKTGCKLDSLAEVRAELAQASSALRAARNKTGVRPVSRGGAERERSAR